MNRLTIGRFELSDGQGEFRVEHPLPKDARQFLGFMAANAEPHRRHFFDPKDNDQVWGVEERLEALQGLPELHPGGTYDDRQVYTDEQLVIPRYAIGTLNDGQGEKVVSAAKIGPRYPGDHAAFADKEWINARRPPAWKRALLRAPTLPLMDDEDRLQQELFELTVAEDQGGLTPDLTAMTLLPLVNRLPLRTEVRFTVDEDNAAERGIYQARFRMDQVTTTGIHPATGKHVLQVMQLAGVLAHRVEHYYVDAQGHRRLQD